jgi:multiple sugar transport system ATP-binding protein
LAAITLRGVGKVFGKASVIRDVDLAVRDKEFVVFVGPSGCGKSTLLRLIAGLEDVSAGRILFDGQDVGELAPAERGIAMVFQSYALYPHMTVFDNMAFGLKLARVGRAGVEERVRRAAQILQIEPLLDRKPKQLSGGQRQRVAIGRAIVREPRVFLFDEPLSNLDAALRVQMRVEIAKLHRQLDATMIYVTHDQVEAMTLAERIVVLNGGRVEQVGTPLELYRRPCNVFVAAFIGSPAMNLLGCTVSGQEDGQLALATRGGQSAQLPLATGAVQPGASMTLGLRPEHLVVDQGEVQLQGEVVAVERLGAESYVHLALGPGETLVMKSEGSSAARVGEVLRVGAAASDCYLFDAGGVALARAGED